MKNRHIDSHDETNIYMKSIENYNNKKQHYNNNNFNYMKSNSTKLESTQRRKKIFFEKR